MPRNNKRNPKIRTMPKSQGGHFKLSENQNDNLTQSEPSKDDGPATSKSTTLNNSKSMENLERSFPEMSCSCSNKKPVKGKSKSNVNKNKNMPQHQEMNFSDSGDDEPSVDRRTLRYVDVARSAIEGTGKAVYEQRTQDQFLDLGLEEFPLLQPRKYLTSDAYNQRSEEPGSDSNVHESDACSDETCLSEAETNNDGFEGSSEGSSGSCWTEGSNDTSSEKDKNASFTDYGGGDTRYTSDWESGCAPEVNPQISTFSQEWLDATVRSLAVPFRVSIPAFNFYEPDFNFPRFVRQFDDANYARLEDRALFALSLAQNKEFFGDGPYM